MMTATARDVMQTEVLVLNESDSLLEAHQFFVRHDITGAPVVDIYGRLVGVVSIRDLIRTEDTDHDVNRTVADYFSNSPGYANPGVDLDHLREGLSEIQVSEVMTRDPIWVAPDSSVKEIAALIRKHQIHRVLVATPGPEEVLEVAGIISLFDLVALLE
jgi:CBS domain-containing protein